VQSPTAAGLDTLASASDFAAAFGAVQAAAAQGDLPRADGPPFWECRHEGLEHEGLEPEALGSRAAAATADDARAATAAEGGAHRGAPDAIVELVPRAAGRAKPPSSHDAPALWAFDPFGDDDIALRGVLVHECFREIHSIETLLAAVAPDPTRLAELVQRAASRAAVEKGTPVSERLRDEARAMLVRLAAGAGTPGSVAESLRIGPRDEVRNEFPFLRETPTGAVTSGRIDRLVLHRDDGGRVVRATILDYKTGAVGKSSEQLAATLIGYRDQMRAYCGAVEELWSLEPGAARAELLFVDREEVVPA
jgi:hypothetical protein